MIQINQIFMNNDTIQVIGVFAMIFSLLVFQANNRKQMLSLHSVANFLYFVHLYLLNGLTGALTSLIAGVRNLIYTKYEKGKRPIAVPLIFIGILAIVCVITWKDWTSLLPISGGVLGTISFWQKKPKNIRLFSLFVSPMWFVYGIINGSYAIILTELVMFSSDVIGIIRYDILKKKKSKPFAIRGPH